MKGASRPRKIIIFVLLLAIVGLFAWGQGSFKRGLMLVFKPIMSMANASGNTISIFTSAILNTPYSISEIRGLREETLALRSRVAILEEMEHENAVLKEALGRAQADISLVYARVIGRPVSGVDDVITIDVGSAQGIRENMPVLAPGNIHLGYISQVSARAAQIKLLSDVGEKTEVYFPESGITSVAEGEGLGVLSVKVPASIEVRDKEPIFTTGEKNYVVGFVEKIEKYDAGPFQVIKTKIPVSLYDIRTVFVVGSL